MYIYLFLLFFTLPLCGMRPAMPLRSVMPLKIPKINTVPCRHLTVTSKHGTIELPDHIYKTIFPHYYPQRKYNNICYQDISHLESITEKLINPDNFDNTKRLVKTLYDSTGSAKVIPPFFSYAMYLACKWKAVNNASINEKYAYLIDEILHYHTAHQRLWDENDMWIDQKYTFPLNVAISNNLEQIARILLAYNTTQVNIKNDTVQHSPLHIVQDAKLAQLLLEKGADINAQDADGNTPLHLCAAPLVKTLLKHNANIFIKNKSLETIFGYDKHYSPSHEGKSLNDWVKEKLDLDKENLNFWTDEEKHADTTYIFYRGLTPLMKAVCDEDMEKLNNLILFMPKNNEFKTQLKSACVIAKSREKRKTGKAKEIIKLLNTVKKINQ